MKFTCAAMERLLKPTSIAVKFVVPCDRIQSFGIFAKSLASAIAVTMAGIVPSPDEMKRIPIWDLLSAISAGCKSAKLFKIFTLSRSRAAKALAKRAPLPLLRPAARLMMTPALAIRRDRCGITRPRPKRQTTTVGPKQQARARACQFHQALLSSLLR